MIYSEKTCWKNRPYENEKPWGREVVWATLSGINGKLIFINKGKSTSLKFYDRKDEVIFVRKGKVQIVWDNNSFDKDQELSKYSKVKLIEGDSFCIQAGCPYRIKAIQNSEIIEIGSCSNSAYTIIHDDYGREF
jgi:mannose-6-phosphate isomerase-like protein (cupin superfamily)